jgi:hypothetical protein
MALSEEVLDRLREFRDAIEGFLEDQFHDRMGSSQWDSALDPEQGTIEIRVTVDGRALTISITDEDIDGGWPAIRRDKRHVRAQIDRLSDRAIPGTATIGDFPAGN